MLTFPPSPGATLSAGEGAGGRSQVRGAVPADAGAGGGDPGAAGDIFFMASYTLNCFLM